jgi:hypothetical protein
MASAKRVSTEALAEADALILSLIQDALRGLRFGSVTFVVQDGVIAHVERVEKKRLVSLRSRRRNQSDSPA